MLVNGKWSATWQPVQAKDTNGAFIRQVSQFRNWISVDSLPGPTGEGGFPAETGRYHLYVALTCPWASCCEAMTGFALRDFLRHGP